MSSCAGVCFCAGVPLCGNCFRLLGSSLDLSLHLTVKISCSNFGHLGKWIWGSARSCGHLWIVEWLLSRERPRFLLNPIAPPLSQLWGGNFCKRFLFCNECASQQHFLTTQWAGQTIYFTEFLLEFFTFYFNWGLAWTAERCIFQLRLLNLQSRDDSHPLPGFARPPTHLNLNRNPREPGIQWQFPSSLSLTGSSSPRATHQHHHPPGAGWEATHPPFHDSFNCQIIQDPTMATVGHQFIIIWTPLFKDGKLMD